jgi:hypothetical protein
MDPNQVSFCVQHEVRVSTDGKDPLQGQWYSPSPLIGSLIEGIRNGSNDNTSDGPAHLKGSGSGASKGKRHNLAGIGRGVGDENTPRNALKSLSNHENGKRFGLEADISQRVQLHIM